MIYSHKLVGASDSVYVLFFGACTKNAKIETIAKNTDIFFEGSYPLITKKITFTFTFRIPKLIENCSKFCTITKTGVRAFSIEELTN